MFSIWQASESGKAGRRSWDLAMNGSNWCAIHGSNEVDAVNPNVVKACVVCQKEIHPGSCRASKLDGVRGANIFLVSCAQLRKIARCGQIKWKYDRARLDCVFIT